MESSNVWPLLKGTEAQQEQGLSLSQQGYSQNPSPSYAMQLGVTYLWLRRYQSAYEHFSTVLQNGRQKADPYFGMAGVAKWCLGEPEEAVSVWRAGLKANYARTAGLNVIMPMLLFFASATKPQTCEMSYVTELLLNATKDLRIKTWPGPIARMLLGSTQVDFPAIAKGGRHDNSSNHYWLTDFYTAVLRYKESDKSVFKGAMRKLTDMSRPEWSNERNFLSRLWHEEFFLARHEVE